MIAISEKQAAIKLGAPRQTLAYWRKAGKLAPGVLVGSRFGQPAGQGVSILYDEARLDAVLAETAELFAH